MIHLHLCYVKLNFYPRSPCGERLFLLRKITITVDISIHALLAESDSLTLIIGFLVRVFLSTLSLRRATCQWRRSVKLFRQFLSTLSLRRATVAPVLAVGRAGYFYPRSPCGERRDKDADWVRVYVFLSTLSLRRATWAWMGGLNYD